MQFTPVTVPTVDLQSRAISRLLRQFQNSPVMLFMLQALVSEVQSFCTACTQTMQLRTPADAAGTILDAIGRIVGQDRILWDYSKNVWFQPDTTGQGPDQSPAYCEGGPIFANSLMDDGLYKILIQSKVYRNFVKFCSVPECQEAAMAAFGVNVSFVFTGPLQANLIVSPNIPLYVLAFLTWMQSDNTCDNRYLMPYPAGFSLSGTMFVPPGGVFRPDVVGDGPDGTSGASVVFDF